MLTGVAKKTAGEFFAAVDDVLNGRAACRRDGLDQLERAAASGADGAAQQTVFEAPGATAALQSSGRLRAGGARRSGSGAGRCRGRRLAVRTETARLMRAFTAAAVQVQPQPGPLTAASIAANVEHCVDWVRDCVRESGAELVVLPETCTTGFTPGHRPGRALGPGRRDPRPLRTSRCIASPPSSGVHLVYGAYERGGTRGLVYNAAVLIGPDGAMLGVYRKTHPFCTEIVTGGGWVTPGDDICVVETELGGIGLIICFDGDYPELSRITALHGAEVIARPSALLRRADIWELTNRARAYDNHVYVVGANATGVDPAGVLYFGNSMIVTPVAEVVARGSTHE